MPDKSLIDFIVNQKKIGAHIEKIRSDLLTTDWIDADIDAALLYIEQRDIKSKIFARSLKKGLFMFFGVILILGGTYITLTLMGREVPLIPEKKVQTINFPDFTEKIPDELKEETVSKPVVDDITLVRKIFETEFKDIKYIRAEKNGSDIIVSAIAKDEFGNSVPKDFVYVKESGIWNMSISKTEERTAYLLELASSTNPIAPRIVVSEIKVRPAPPRVNNKDTEIHISFKNVGLASTTDQTMITVVFDTKNPVNIPYKKIIAPDETATVIYKLYPIGKKYTDVAGKHTVQVILDNNEEKSLEFDLY